MASFSVVSNVSASNAQANLNTTNIGLQRTLTRLSSGFRINQAGDDAAGLAVANSYRSEQAVLNQGIRNANDGLSTLQIKNGALDNISTLLDRLSTLASQSASAGFAGSRTTLNNEFTDVVAEIAREVTVAGLGTSQGFSVFVSGGAGGTVGGTIGAADTTTLGINASSIATAAGAATAVARHLGGRRHGGHGGRQRRFAAEPPAVLHRPRAVPVGQHQGCRKPHPRRQRGGRVVEPDALQHPDAERYRRPGPGQPAELVGAVAPPVIHRTLAIA